MRIRFCDDEHAVALTGDRVRHHFFRAAVAVHFRGIDQGHAEIDAKAQSLDLIRAYALVLAHAPGALTQCRNAFAVGQLNCLH